MLNAAVLKGTDLGHLGSARGAKVFRFLARIRHKRDPAERPKDTRHDSEGNPGFARGLGDHSRPGGAVAVGTLPHIHGEARDRGITVQIIVGARIGRGGSCGRWFGGGGGTAASSAGGSCSNRFHRCRSLVKVLI